MDFLGNGQTVKKKCRASVAQVSRGVAQVSRGYRAISRECQKWWKTRFPAFSTLPAPKTQITISTLVISLPLQAKALKFSVLDGVFLVTDMFWQTGGLIGGHGASSHRVSPKTRPKEARRTLNGGVALFIQGFIARMPLSKPRLGCRRIFFRVWVLPPQPPAGLDRSAVSGPKHVSLSCGFGKKISCCLPTGHIYRLC